MRSTAIISTNKSCSNGDDTNCSDNGNMNGDSNNAIDGEATTATTNKKQPPKQHP